MKNRVSGFTLMEMMITIVMLGVLTAVALPNYQKAIGKQKSNQFKFQMRNLNFALENYRAQNKNKYPTGTIQNDGLAEILNLPDLMTNWRKVTYFGADDGYSYIIVGAWNRTEYEEVLIPVPGQDEPISEIIAKKVPVEIKITSGPFSDDKNNPNPCCVQCPSMYLKCK